MTPPIAIHRAPGPSGVLVEEARVLPRIWRWPGWAMNDYHGHPPSIGSVRDSWVAADEYYRNLYQGNLRR